MPQTKRKAAFIEVMECLPVKKVPDGREWVYEIKLDGYRLEAVKAGGEVRIFSRNHNDLNHRFPYIVESLKQMPDETVFDGELVALDAEGKPNFGLLQNFRSAESHIVFYLFDLLVHKGRDLMQLPLLKRKKLLASALKPNQHVSLS